ncbi:hypothetical protein SOPP22_09810 [Shewanella sp. OPT22]|nr:hypothetical protein SOPP22_09810 [Shewanella sp. OPT22]
MRTLLKTLIFLGLVLSFQAGASSLSQCSKQNEGLSDAKESLNLVGTAKLKVWFWNVYTSDLYTPTGKYSGKEQCLLFEINYLMDISKEELINSTVENWQHLGLTPNDYQGFVFKLEKIWPNVSKGDQLAFQVLPTESVFYLNGKPIGKIEDKHFASIFLSIWLSKKTTQPRLRKKLLGATS